VLVALQAGQRESSESWAGLLRDLRARGRRPPRLVVGDGHLGIGGGLRQVYPEAAEQRCWNHRLLNLLDRLAKRDQRAAKELLRRVMYAPSLQAAEREKSAFQSWCGERGYPQAGVLIEQDWERLTAFYAFPREHGVHSRTTNPVESPLAALRLRTDAAKRFRRVENATAVIWKRLLLAEHRFRRLNAPGLLKAVFPSAVCVNGVLTLDQPVKLAA